MEIFSMMKVYIAGSINGRNRIYQESKRLELYGFTILSDWLTPGDFLEDLWDGKFSGPVAETMAKKDLYAILDADLVIVDTLDKSYSGGSDTELGAAVMRSLLGKHCSVIHIGHYRNVFQTLVKEHYNTWNEFYDYLDERKQ